MPNKPAVLWPDALALTALFLLLALLPAISSSLEYLRAPIREGEYWRLFTAHFVHLNFSHALLNAAGVVLIVWVFPQELSRRDWWIIVMLAPLLISAGLWWKQPGLAGYAGFSGVLHGLLYFAALRLWQTSRWLAVGMLLLLCGRQAWEQTAAYNPDYLRTVIGGRVMPDAHLFGGLAGLLYGAVALWCDRHRARLGKAPLAGL
ncbi:MAG: rhombosortase [Moraxellaceae bacterium]|nr:rhombosortase [Moraxellaceae bacterium]